MVRDRPFSKTEAPQQHFVQACPLPQTHLRQVDIHGDLCTGTDVLFPPFRMDTSLAVIYFSSLQ